MNLDALANLPTGPTQKPSNFVPSQYQSAVFETLTTTSDNLIVDAVAGSGKTRTIREALRLFPNSKLLYVAFNKHIVEELKSLVPHNVHVCTSHSFGMAACRRNMPGTFKVNENKCFNILKYHVLDEDEKKLRETYPFLRILMQVVSLAKANACKTLTMNKFDAIVQHHGFDIRPDKYDQCYEYASEILQVSRTQKRVIDFDDMIYLPVTNPNWDIDKYEITFVDELQDLNQSQLLLMQAGSRRIVGVGDEHQAIYGFRGADVNSMSNFQKMFNATRRPLSICYRCSQRVIEAAQAFVPHIEFHPEAPIGKVGEVSEDQWWERVKEGDYVLCRTTAPLVKNALRCLKAKRKATIKGRDIGEDLMELFPQRHDLGGFLVRKAESLKNNDLAYAALCDRVAAFEALYEAYGEGIKQGIEEIFSNTTKGIIFSSIHRSKGLETDRVWLLAPELLPHPKASTEWECEQERNLHYIALTRAKKEFFYVLDNFSPQDSKAVETDTEEGE